MSPEKDRDEATVTSPGAIAPTVPAQESFKSDPTAETVYGQTEPALNTTVLPRPEGFVGMTLGGRYFVESELGQGGIGAVYLARDRKLVDKPVVIKVLLEKSLQSEWAVRKFDQEKEALARVDHPGIIGILDTGELPDGKPYIVMQYVDGFTLRSIMLPEGADLDRAASLMEQIGHALSAAHEEGIFHRDLKPENIMIQMLAGNREQVKIIDFGIAKVRDSQVGPSTVIGATAGTIAYMSPEQLRAEKVTASSDVYALGVIAYELVTGRRPFNPETLFQLLEMQREGVRVRPKDLRPALPEPAQAVILKALDFDRKDRYQSAAEFGEDFARAIDRGVETPGGYVDREAPARTIPTQSELAPKPSLHPVLIVAVSLLLVGVVAVGAWWALKSRPTGTTQPTTSPTSNTASGRTLSYWLTVQKIRDGKPYQEPFESSGQEIFENGWKFRLNASSPQAGHLYLLNEGPDGKGSTSYNLLYPTPSTNNGTAKLAADQQMQTGWFVFDENQGTEKFWVVWSLQPVSELEAVKGVVNPEDKGTIKDAGQAAAVREFLAKHSSSKPTMEKDSARKQTNLKGKGDFMVSLVELEHH